MTIRNLKLTHLVQQIKEKKKNNMKLIETIGKMDE